MAYRAISLRGAATPAAIAVSVIMLVVVIALIGWRTLGVGASSGRATVDVNRVRAQLQGGVKFGHE